jgi:hypothetical protein
MFLRTLLAFPLYVLIAGALVAAGVGVSATYDYNMHNDTIQIAAMTLILAAPLVCGGVQYVVGRKLATSELSLWGSVAIAALLAPLIALTSVLLLIG